MDSRFVNALLNPDHPVPFGLTAYSTPVPVSRFAVYRNNVIVSLINALAARFPATQRLIGESAFRAAAQEYARGHPPSSPLMMFYGEDFPEFLAGFEPLRPLPYLADVARLEAARTRAHHAADAVALGVEEFAAVAGGDLATLRVVPHPSAEVLRSVHPIVTIRAMNAGEQELAAIEEWRGEDALVVRPRLDVHVHVLPPGGAAFLEALFAGSALAEAAETAHSDNADFDLTANLFGLVSSGVLSGLATTNTEVER